MLRVTVIGAGLAGLAASLELARSGVGVRLVSVQHSERAQSVMAAGGINAALDLSGEHDSWQEHYEDTLRAGVWLADANAVWGLAREAPAIVRELDALGVPFNHEGGKMVQRYFGGQKKKRTAFAKSSTGKLLVSALVDAVRAFEQAGLVERMAHHELVGLDIRDGRCRGAWVQDSRGADTSFFGGPVILAAGGMGGLFGSVTTGSAANTGDVAALALASGVELANLEFIQYHPTTIPLPDKHLLVSEAARGEGGRLMALRDGKSWYFMEERFPEMGNLMPRDVVSREEAAVMADPACTGQIWLDMRQLSREVWRNRLSDLRDEIRHYLGIDAAKEPVPIEPGIHYCMGGLFVDEHHRCSVSGLWAAGECACQYHGANRLGGNSLLGAIYGGKVAARDVASMAGDKSAEPASPPPRTAALVEPSTKFIVADNPISRELEHILASCLGISRTGEELETGAHALEELLCRDCSGRMKARIELGRAMVLSALAREESRGAHMRRDFPERDERFLRTTIACMSEGEPSVSFRPLPEAREGVGVA
ncbi:MAG: FAD-binding protein [Coriobacteriales bacterium]|nr:FAD-binding protein [Coriobacteriales bacterium]